MTEHDYARQACEALIKRMGDSPVTKELMDGFAAVLERIDGANPRLDGVLTRLAEVERRVQSMQNAEQLKKLRTG